MKIALLLTATLWSGLVSAQEGKRTCQLQANHWYNMQNLGRTYFKPMTQAECFEKGLELFNSDVEAGYRRLLLTRDQMIVKKWATQYKRVKAKYFAEDGSTNSQIYKRDEVVDGPVTVTTYQLESAWRCWTKQDCVVVSKWVTQE